MAIIGNGHVPINFILVDGSYITPSTQARDGTIRPGTGRVVDDAIALHYTIGIIALAIRDIIDGLIREFHYATLVNIHRAVRHTEAPQVPYANGTHSVLEHINIVVVGYAIRIT